MVPGQQNCAQFRSHERAINYSETTCDAEANFHFTCDRSVAPPESQAYI